LNVIPIKVPPLRERMDDLPGLVDEFLKEFSLSTNIKAKEVSKEAIEVLQEYEWPGNVRELKNLMERLMIMLPHMVIEAKDIPPPYNKSPDMKGSLESAFGFDLLKEARSRFEKAFIESKLHQFNGNISQTAEAIGVERSNLHKKIKTYGLDGFKSQ